MSALKNFLFRSGKIKSGLYALRWSVRQFPVVFPKGVILSAAQWIDNHTNKKDLYYRRKSHWYKKIYNEEIHALEKPAHTDESLHRNFYACVTYQSPEANLYYLAGAYVFSDNGVVISEDNRVFAEFTHNFFISPLKRSKLFKPFYTFRTRIKRYDCNVAVLATPECTNYYHWMVDALPRLKLLGEVVKNIDLFVVPRNLSRFHYETLAQFGITADRLLRLGPEEKIFCAHLYVTSLPGSSGYTSRWSLNFLRKSFAPTPVAQNGLIYLNRKDAGQRKVTNEEELEAFLQSRGFRSVSLSDYRFREQVDLCRSAKVIVAIHGAGTTNAIFNEKCSVIEIFSPEYVPAQYYYQLSALLGHAYWYLIGDKTPGTGWGDVTVNIEKLRQILDAAAGEKIARLPTSSVTVEAG